MTSSMNWQRLSFVLLHVWVLGVCGVVGRIRPSRLCRAFVPVAGVTGACRRVTC